MEDKRPRPVQPLPHQAGMDSQFWRDLERMGRETDNPKKQESTDSLKKEVDVTSLVEKEKDYHFLVEDLVEEEDLQMEEEDLQKNLQMEE